jgi:hypothetical protein
MMVPKDTTASGWSREKAKSSSQSGVSPHICNQNSRAQEEETLGKEELMKNNNKKRNRG